MAKQNNHWLDPQLYPFRSRFFSVNGQKLHYIDEGRGKVILFVHGTPSWSFDFRHQIKTLSGSYRCIAPDHMGFGLSDKPETYDYSTQNHGRTLEALIEFLGIRNIVLVVHDFGGPIGFDYALRHPENVRKIVILNSWLWDCSGEPAYEKLKGILRSPLLPFLYKHLNFSPRFLLPLSFADKRGLTRDIRRHYTAPFSKSSERMGALAFARSLLNDQPWFGELWNKIDLVSNKPALFIWGMKDQYVTPGNLDKFGSAFVSKTVLRLENCGHFPQEEQNSAVSAHLADFLSEDHFPPIPRVEPGSAFSS